MENNVENQVIEHQVQENNVEQQYLENMNNGEQQQYIEQQDPNNQGMDMNQQYVYSEELQKALYQQYASINGIQQQQQGVMNQNQLMQYNYRMPEVVEEEPIYVNAKQYHRILIRREQRAKLERHNKALKTRKPFLHESRHQHAKKRKRGPNGRFMSKKEREKMEQEEREKKENMGEGTIIDQVVTATVNELQELSKQEGMNETQDSNMTNETMTQESITHDSLSMSQSLNSMNETQDDEEEEEEDEEDEGEGEN
jgi:hypothetical protein